MLIKFFKQSYLQQFIALFAIQVFLWGKYLISPQPLDIHNRIHPIYGLIMNFVGDNQWTATFIAFLMVALGAVLINVIMIKSELAPKNSLIPGLIFITLLSQGPSILSLYPELISVIFILLAIDRIMQCYGESDILVINNILSAGLFISLAAFSYLPAIWFMLIIWIAMFIFRQLSFRIWVISIIGLMLPFMYFAAYNYVFDKPVEIFRELLNYYGFIDQILLKYPDPTYIIWGIIALFTIISLLYSLTHLNEWNVNVRRKIIVLLWLLIITLPMGLYGHEDLLASQVFQMIPITVFVSFYISSIKIKKWQEAVFLLFLILVFLNNHLY